VSVAVDLDSGFAAAVNYSVHNVGTDLEITHTGVGVGYTYDAFSIGANWGQYTVSETGQLDVDINGWGLAAAYDFGGGLSMHVGYGDGEVDGVDTESTWSLGLAMSF
jgi:outer membrane protein OmpU